MQYEIVIKTYDVPQLARLDQAKLADEGIESFLRDENIVLANPFASTAVGGIKLVVRKKDAAKARKVLSYSEKT